MRVKVLNSKTPPLPKLLLFSSGACLYGAEKALMNVCAALEGKFEITVVLPDDGPLAEELKEHGYRVKLHRLAVLSSPHSLPRTAMYFFLASFNTLYIMLYAVLCGYDRIVSNTLLLVQPPLAAVLCRKRHIWIFREYSASSFFNRALSRLALALPGRIICMSENIRKEMFGGLRCGENKVIVVHDPLPSFSEEQADAASLREELSVPPQAAVILLPSRIHPSKGQLEFLRDFSGVLRKHDAIVLLAGDCSSCAPRSVVYKRGIRDFINGNGLQDRVKMLGFRKDIDRLFLLCDICVFPILRNEPFGLSFQEALSAGKQVLYYSSQGLEEAASFFPGHRAVLLDRISLERAILSALPLRAASHPDYRSETSVSRRRYRESVRRIITF